MKKVLGFLSVLLIVASTSYAEDMRKHNVVSFGSHAIVISNNVSGSDDDNLNGLMLSYQRNITRHIAARVGIFSDEHEDNSDIVSTGMEAQLLFGTNFIRRGWNIYAGLGFFDESWDFDNNDVDGFDFRGYLISLGGGYNFEHVSIDLIVNIRDASDYEDKMDEFLHTSNSIDATASSAALSVGIRF